MIKFWEGWKIRFYYPTFFYSFSIFIFFLKKPWIYSTKFMIECFYMGQFWTFYLVLCLQRLSQVWSLINGAVKNCLPKAVLNIASSSYNLIGHEPNQLILWLDTGCHYVPVKSHYLKTQNIIKTHKCSYILSKVTVDKIKD